MTKTLKQYAPLEMKPRKLYISKGQSVKSRMIVGVPSSEVFLNTKTRDAYGITTGVQNQYSANAKKTFI